MLTAFARLIKSTRFLKTVSVLILISTFKFVVHWQYKQNNIPDDIDNTLLPAFAEPNYEKQLLDVDLSSLARQKIDKPAKIKAINEKQLLEIDLSNHTAEGIVKPTRIKASEGKSLLDIDLSNPMAEEIDKPAKIQANDGKQFINIDLSHVTAELIRPTQGKQLSDLSNLTSKEIDKPIWPEKIKPSDGKQLLDIDLSNMTTSENEFATAYMPVMLSRARAVSEYCRANPELMTPRRTFNVAWIRRENYAIDAAWCPNIKVAHGTWVVNLLLVGHYLEKKGKALNLTGRETKKLKKDRNYSNFHNLPFVFHPPKSDFDKINFFKQALRFIIVRHPFTRLLSAYRNKIDHAHPAALDDNEFGEVRTNILRFNGYHKTEGVFPTFPDFINYVVANASSSRHSSDWLNIPRYWESFWSHCEVCASDYTVIMKLETMPQDEKFISIVANFPELKEREKSEWRHKVNKTSSFDVADLYYKDLSMQQMLDVYKIYKHDFELFQYSIDTYLPLAKDYQTINES